MSTQDVLIISSLVGAVLPAVVALLAHVKASKQVKALVLLVLSTAAGIVVPALSLPRLSWTSVGLSVLTAEVTAIASHFGLLKPAGLTGSAGVIARNVPAGVGKP